MICATQFDTADQAIAIANRTGFGPVAGVFPRDLDRGHGTAGKLPAGPVFGCRCFAGGISPPFGGGGKSGYGRGKGLEALYTCLRTENLAARPGG